MKSETYVLGLSKFLGFKKTELIKAIKDFALENHFNFEQIMIKEAYLRYLRANNETEYEIEDIKNGNLIRKASGREDVFAVKAVLDLLKMLYNGDSKKNIILVSSLKTQSELEFLKKAFGDNFFALKATCSNEVTKDFLSKKNSKYTEEEIEDLINKDRRKLSDIIYNYDLDFYNNGTRNQLAKLRPFLEEKTKFKSTIDLSRVKSEIIQIKFGSIFHFLNSIGAEISELKN